MPSGAPRRASQGAQRCSKGMMRALPIGDSPRTARTTRLPTASRRPARAKRVGSRTRPASPIEITRLDGVAKKPRTWERTKNIGRPCRPGSGASGLLLPGLVTRLGLVVHRVKAGKLHAALALADDPGLHPLVLGALLGDET